VRVLVQIKDGRIAIGLKSLPTAGFPPRPDNPGQLFEIAKVPNPAIAVGCYPGDILPRTPNDYGRYTSGDRARNQIQLSIHLAIILGRKSWKVSFAYGAQDSKCLTKPLAAITVVRAKCRIFDFSVSAR
jgi:hypothetical protein